RLALLRDHDGVLVDGAAEGAGDRTSMSTGADDDVRTQRVPLGRDLDAVRARPDGPRAQAFMHANAGGLGAPEKELVELGAHDGEEVPLDVELPVDVRLAEPERRRATKDPPEGSRRAEDDGEGTLARADADRGAVPEAERQRHGGLGEHATQEIGRASRGH